MTSSGFGTSGMETTMLPPSTLTSDSATPLELTRLRMMSKVVSSCSWVGLPPRGLVGTKVTLEPPRRSSPSRGSRAGAGIPPQDRHHPPDHHDQQEHDQQGDDVATGSWHGRVAPSGCKAFETESLAVFAPVRAGQSRLWPVTVMRNLQSRPSAARRHIIIRVRKISKYSRMSDTP